MSLTKIIETGSYAGNSSPRSISVGWQPAVVMIVSDRSQGPPAGRAVSFKLASHPSDGYVALEADADLYTGITLTSDGFDVDGDQKINQSGSTFYWVAIRDGPWLDYGTYSGQGVGGTTVVTGRQPGMVLLAQTTGTVRFFIKNPNESGSFYYQSTNEISAVNQFVITSTGFDTEGVASDDGQTYYWVALYDIPGSTRNFETGTYAGNLISPRGIALGKQPKFVLIQADDRADPAAYKVTGMAGGDHGETDASYDYITDGVTITSSGFEVGLGYNATGSNYRYWAGYE